MKHKRLTFPALPGFSGFSLEVPPGFTEPAFSRRSVDLTVPTNAEPLALLANVATGAILCVAGRPSYKDGSVEDWARKLCEHFGLTVTGCVSGFIGGDTHQHPGVFVEGERKKGGGHSILRIAMIEDGGRLFTVHSTAPADHWKECAEAIEHAVASLELAQPAGPTVPCVPNGPVPIHDMYGITVGEWPRGRDAERIDLTAFEQGRSDAIELARALIERDRFDQAEELLRNVDPYFQPSVALSRLYTERLRSLVSSGRVDGSLAKEVFEKALDWSWRSYPDPHTVIEAEQFEEGQATDLAMLVGILGYDPRKERT